MSKPPLLKPNPPLLTLLPVAHTAIYAAISDALGDDPLPWEHSLANIIKMVEDERIPGVTVEEVKCVASDRSFYGTAYEI